MESLYGLEDLGFRVEGLGCRVEGLVFRGYLDSEVCSIRRCGSLFCLEVQAGLGV